MTVISNSEDVLDARDIIERIETLRQEREDFEHDDDGNLTGAAWSDSNTEDAEELATLEAFIAQMKGYGGDHEWEGDWYPVTLIRDTYFTEYAEELAEDIGAVNREASWPNNCIDWDAAADALKQDYTSYDFDGVIYWAR